MAMKFRVSDYHRSNGTVWQQIFSMDRGLESELFFWCVEQFGPLEVAVLPEERRWSISLDRHSTYYFRNPRDCTAFLLRWS